MSVRLMSVLHSHVHRSSLRPSNEYQGERFTEESNDSSSIWDISSLARLRVTWYPCQRSEISESTIVQTDRWGYHLFISPSPISRLVLDGKTRSREQRDTLRTRAFITIGQRLVLCKSSNKNSPYFESCFFDNLCTECTMSFHDEFKLRRLKHLFQLSTSIVCTGRFHAGRRTRERTPVFENNAKENIVHHAHYQRDGKWLKQLRVFAIALFLSFLCFFHSPFLFPFWEERFDAYRPQHFYRIWKQTAKANAAYIRPCIFSPCLASVVRASLFAQRSFTDNSCCFDQA